MTEERHTDENGHTYWLDGDGEFNWDQPKDWSLDKPPEEMNKEELCAAVARLMGCEPKWWPYYKDWTCTCERGEHAADSQCSIIAPYSTDSRWARRVAFWLEKKGLPVPKMTTVPRRVCEQALLAGKNRAQRALRLVKMP